jgi:hypothetical protein
VKRKKTRLKMRKTKSRTRPMKRKLSRMPSRPKRKRRTSSSRTCSNNSRSYARRRCLSLGATISSGLVELSRRAINKPSKLRKSLRRCSCSLIVRLTTSRKMKRPSKRLSIFSIFYRFFMDKIEANKNKTRE